MKDRLQELYDHFGGDPRAVAAASDEELLEAQVSVYGKPKDTHLRNGWPKNPRPENNDSAWKSEGIQPQK